MGKRKGSKQAEQSRLENHAKKMRELRRNESVEQATTRREANSRRMASQREEETDQQCTTRRELDRNRADTRRKPKGNYLAALITIETTIPEEFKCELMDQTCVTCAAKFFKLERNTHNFYTKCCHNGKVALPELGLVPDLFQNLLTTDTAEAKNFKDNIRSYNSSLGFTSMVAKVEMPPGNGPYCYRIHGQVYHAVSSLHPTDKDPCYGQLYILDASEAVDARVGNNPKCLPDLLLKLDTIIREINPYAQAYRNMAEVETEEVEKAEAEGREAREVRMYFKSDASKDQRRYNAPTGNGYSDIAAVFVGDNGEPPQYRDICIYPKTETIKRISVLSQNCDPMSFPLLFPNGETGWTINMEHGGARTNIRDKVTALQFYAYRLAIRDGFSLLHSSGKLFQQYVVNAYCNVEATRLQFIRSNQSLLRVDLYQGLLDHIQTRAVDENVKPGNLVILPSSFNGGPRAQQQRYQDSMAIVRKFGKPDLFITMTCNPLWDEITKSIEPYQLAQNRPDVVARVFNMKLQELLKDLTVRHVFGVPTAYMYSIEFQKRGLPHAHILLTLATEDKIRDKEDIDKVVSAEFPLENGRLFEIVKRNMVHGPCGAHNPKSPCMVDGKCSKGFPKDFAVETQENTNGYPQYKRRDDRIRVKVGRHEVSNQWIVPYNPYLSSKYNAHINVEVCSSIKSVKYIYKYIYKGHDCASIQFDTHSNENGELVWDEVKTFLEARYVSAPEAMWHLLEGKMHDKSHTVINLPVHLKNMQTVCFREDQIDEAVLRNADKKTMLTAYFELNEKDPAAREYYYHDLPTHYVYHSKGGYYTPRVRGAGSVIGRMAIVSPKDEQRFYLRLLLLHVKGATSYDDLKKVNCKDNAVKECGSFKEAAIELGLLEDDSECERSLDDASLLAMPIQIRNLYATICVFCQPKNPVALWQKFKNFMIEDFQLTMDEEKATDNALHHVECFLKQHGLNLEKIGLPSYNNENVVAVRELLNVEAEKKLGEDCYSKLTDTQRKIIDTILKAIKGTGTETVFFLEGPAGSGKTFIYNTLIHILKGNGDCFLSCASTGIAATLVIDGATAHSTFKIPIPVNETSVCRIKGNSLEAKKIRNSKLIIWDEAPMMPSQCFLTVNTLLQDLTGQKKIFGGKICVFGGDFRQLLPVIPRGSRGLIVSSCLNQKANLWSQFKVYRLKENMRTGPNENEFCSWLLKLGNGDLGDIVEIPARCYIKNGDPVQVLYGDVIHSGESSDFGKAILCSTNQEALELNEKVLEILNGNCKEYRSIDSTEEADEFGQYPMEFLNSLTPMGMPPHRLRLKIGAVIMLLRNLNTKLGLCNGTRLAVTRMMDFSLEAKFITEGKFVGSTVLIPRICLLPSDANLPFQLRRKQFPVRLSYAMTINKAQGQTFDQICLNIPKPVFTHGQLYVAFSRVRTFDAVKVCGERYTKNVVYQEVLL